MRSVEYFDLGFMTCRPACMNFGYWMLFLVLAFAGMHQSVWARDVSQAKGNLFLTKNHGGGEGWGKTQCESCHALFRIHDSVPKTKTVVEQVGFDSCAGCHGQNGTSMQKRCVICHNNDVMPGVPHRNGRHRHDFSLSNTIPTTDEQCLDCHKASDMDGRFELDKDLTLFRDATGAKPPYANISEFCLRCHTESNPNKKHPIVDAGRRDQALLAEENYRLKDKHGIKKGLGDGANTEPEIAALYYGLRLEKYKYPSVVECVDCHTMHGTNNASNLIIDDSRQAKFFHDQKTRRKPFDRKLGHMKIRVLDNKKFITNPNDDGPPTLSSIIDCSVTKKVKRGNYSQLCVMCHDMKNREEGKQLTEQQLEVMGGRCNTGNGRSGVHFNEGVSCIKCHYHGRSGISGL